MRWDICYFTVLQHKHTRALSYVLYLSLWCGVVWCGVVRPSQKRFDVPGIASVVLL